MFSDSGPAKRSLLGLLFIAIQTYLLFAPPPAFPKREHLVYFPNTAYELNVYKIFGKTPGKTLMLIGGIQGNEPGGFLSADLYADMSLKRGNLIVVPRANFYSILLNQRSPHGDMNRKFTHEDVTDSMEDKIVSILKKLIGQSDYLLNLHDGSGYYFPKYIDKWRNPMRFGQSIIADCETYRLEGKEQTIRLGEIARKVIAGVNPHIQNELYRFHFNNTRTGDKDSLHKEQRKSATYYALTRHHIPAFGIETSKFLPSINLKVRYHNLVINAFMNLFNIVPEHPGVALDPPVLKYLVVSINGQAETVVKDKQRISLRSGDSIRISHIDSNYERGLSLDILGYGDLNDYRKDFVITKDTSLIVRKDNQKFAEIPINISENPGIEGGKRNQKRRIQYLVVESRGQRILLSDGETLDLVMGERMKIVDILPSFSGASEVKVNFKGFVGNWKNNTGEDRGFVIRTDKDLIKRYSLKRDGRLYEIVASRGKERLGRFVVRLREPRLDYLVLKVNGTCQKFLRPGEVLSISLEDHISLEEIGTDTLAKSDFHLSINGHTIKPGEKQRVETLLKGFSGKREHEALVKKGPIILGKIRLALEKNEKIH
jgi:hypothetical protein